MTDNELQTYTTNDFSYDCLLMEIKEYLMKHKRVSKGVLDIFNTSMILFPMKQRTRFTQDLLNDIFDIMKLRNYYDEED